LKTYNAKIIAHPTLLIVHCQLAGLYIFSTNIKLLKIPLLAQPALTQNDIKVYPLFGLVMKGTTRTEFPKPTQYVKCLL
jgi:hypothetical protein